MDRRYWIQNIITVLVSAMIGVAVGFPFYFVEREGTLLRYLLICSAAGFSIGLLGLFAFGLLTKTINHRPFFSFAAVFVIIASGTYLWAIISFQNINWLIFIIIGISELAGMVATSLFYRYSKKLNERLKDTQKRLQ